MRDIREQLALGKGTETTIPRQTAGACLCLHLSHHRWTQGYKEDDCYTHQGREERWGTFVLRACDQPSKRRPAEACSDRTSDVGTCEVHERTPLA